MTDKSDVNVMTINGEMVRVYKDAFELMHKLGSMVSLERNEHLASEYDKDDHFEYIEIYGENALGNKRLLVKFFM